MRLFTRGLALLAVAGGSALALLGCPWRSRASPARRRSRGRCGTTTGCRTWWTVAPALADGRTVPVVCAPLAGTRAEASLQLWREQPA